LQSARKKGAADNHDGPDVKCFPDFGGKQEPFFILHFKNRITGTIVPGIDLICQG
jgi:hypothetical protein